MYIILGMTDAAVVFPFYEKVGFKLGLPEECKCWSSEVEMAHSFVQPVDKMDTLYAA